MNETLLKWIGDGRRGFAIDTSTHEDAVALRAWVKIGSGSEEREASISRFLSKTMIAFANIGPAEVVNGAIESMIGELEAGIAEGGADS